MIVEIFKLSFHMFVYLSSGDHLFGESFLFLCYFCVVRTWSLKVTITYVYRTDDLHGQLEDDDVPGDSSDARSQFPHHNGAVHQ